MPIFMEGVSSDFWQLFREPGSNQYLNPLGPICCTTHCMDRAIQRHHEGKKPAGISGVWPPTGYQTRRYTGDFSGGTNLSQMRTVGQRYYGMTLDTRYRLPWETFLDLLEETRGAILQVWYRRIRDSNYQGSYTFYENHAVWVNGVDRDRGVLTGVVDPLADGRQGLFRGPADYPIALLKAAAGELNVSGTGGYRALGVGLVYAGFTRATGGTSVTPQPSQPAEAIPVNVIEAKSLKAILDGPTLHMKLPQGTPIYRGDFKTVLTRASKDISPPMTGFPGTGWRTVVISTGAPPNPGDPAGVVRTVEAYVKKADGEVF